MPVDEVSLPSSKSISNRLLILKALLNNELEIKNLSNADDTVIMQKVLSKGFNCSIVDVKNAGTCFRFLTAYFALKADEVILTGSSEMKKRPIKILVNVLRELGSDINELGEKGFPPLRIVGNTLRGGDVCIDGGVSSQYITAIMLIAPFLEERIIINITGDFKSKSYVLMTIKLLEHIGCYVDCVENKIVVNPLIKLKINSVVVEYDWSSASYWYQYVSFLPINSTLLIKGLTEESIQGDSIVVALYSHFGIKTEFTHKGAILKKIYKTKEGTFFFNFSSTPDLVQTLVLTCVGEGINGSFTGISHLRYKETDRVEALKNELTKLNYELNIINDDTFEILRQGDLPQKAIINTYNDHRMAMSFASLGLKIKELEIENPEVVIKSYPTFWENFNQL